MCGIVGYIGPKQAQDFLLEGLATLEYRGYDSTGMVAISDNGPRLVRSVGRVESVKKDLENDPLIGSYGIGHTRWATHGAPLERNAHPHPDSNHEFFVVHNGIIENYQAIKAELSKQGVKFSSDTDTETIPQLIAAEYRRLGNVSEAFLSAVGQLRGAFSIVMVSVHAPNTLFAARLSSPLVIGIGEGESYIASDPTPIMEHTKKVIFLNDYEAAVITPDEHIIINLKDSSTVERHPQILDYDADKAVLGDYPHFMLKEIYEAPQTVRAALLGRLRTEQNLVKLGGLDLVEEQLRYIDRIVIVSCGTSYYASLVGEYLIEEIAGIPVEVQLASEFKYRNEPLRRSTAVLAVSQSGETADTIAALNKVAGYGVLRLGVVNAVGSTIARMTDAGVYCHAGAEQSVASTKAFIAQVTVLALIALNLSRDTTPLYEEMLRELDNLPAKIESILANTEHIQNLAKKYAHHRDFLFIGRRYMYPVALEGALKLKELSYIHAEGYAGGEMKHGPLAMIDESFPTIAMALDGEMFEKTLSNIQEIKARGGPVLAICNTTEQLEGIADDTIVVPRTIEQLQPILAVIPMQLFAYYAAIELGKNVDRPRNLAKSVTVE